MTEPPLKPDECQPCPYCLPGMRTGLPDNACENCMNTGLKYPAAVTGPPDDYPGQLKRAAVELFSDDESAGLEAKP